MLQIYYATLPTSKLVKFMVLLSVGLQFPNGEMVGFSPILVLSSY